MNPGESDFPELLRLARKVVERMRETEAALGLTFPQHVRFLVALDIIEAGLAARDRIDVAVGYLILRDLLDDHHADRADRN